MQRDTEAKLGHGTALRGKGTRGQRVVECP